MKLKLEHHDIYSETLFYITHFSHIMYKYLLVKSTVPHLNSLLQTTAKRYYGNRNTKKARNISDSFAGAVIAIQDILSSYTQTFII
jgi:hypothetical protein